MTTTTCLRARITECTPSNEELAAISYHAVLSTMVESLAKDKHRQGSWNQGIEANPRWHLTRVIRHATQALMLLDGLELKDEESVQIHTRNALVRCCLAYAQLGITNEKSPVAKSKS